MVPGVVAVHRPPLVEVVLPPAGAERQLPAEVQVLHRPRAEAVVPPELQLKGGEVVQPHRQGAVVLLQRAVVVVPRQRVALRQQVVVGQQERQLRALGGVLHPREVRPHRRQL